MSEGKRRHGCLITFLVFAIIVDLLLGFIYTSPKYWSSWRDLTFGICCVFNIVCRIAILRWKKWGFWGICLISGINVLLNLARGSHLIWAFIGFAPAAITYGVLHIGKGNKGWPQLE
jgi:hypothetical protein